MTFFFIRCTSERLGSGQIKNTYSLERHGDFGYEPVPDSAYTPGSEIRVGKDFDRWDSSAYKSGSLLFIGPYRLRILGEEYWMDAYSCVLDTRFSRLFRWRYQIAAWLTRTKYRLIKTAIIWDLAERRDGEAVQWSNIYAVCWFKRRVLRQG